MREDDVGGLTLSSRHQKWRNDGKTVREDDVGVLTLSSRHRKGVTGLSDDAGDDVVGDEPEVLRDAEVAGDK